ncbi:hypothetical protein BLNAU_4614 [Blattamonas nauphoetae]|uniref:Uncharacterized protein n=1 Tax=Blattamonas nauphoetae TaxID=2049346 RepID=A0ABQ9Y9I9_9EUKA|nr:hypothetical protein BLNAU_4614 [Blattamonas nauphoetae]
MYTHDAPASSQTSSIATLKPLVNGLSRKTSAEALASINSLTALAYRADSPNDPILNSKELIEEVCRRISHNSDKKTQLQCHVLLSILSERVSPESAPIQRSIHIQTAILLLETRSLLYIKPAISMISNDITNHKEILQDYIDRGLLIVLDQIAEHMRNPDLLSPLTMILSTVDHRFKSKYESQTSSIKKKCGLVTSSTLSLTQSIYSTPQTSTTRPIAESTRPIPPPLTLSTIKPPKIQLSTIKSPNTSTIRSQKPLSSPHQQQQSTKTEVKPSSNTAKLEAKKPSPSTPVERKDSGTRIPPMNPKKILSIVRDESSHAQTERVSLIAESANHSKTPKEKTIIQVLSDSESETVENPLVRNKRQTRRQSQVQDEPNTIKPTAKSAPKRGSEPPKRKKPKTPPKPKAPEPKPVSSSALLEITPRGRAKKPPASDESFLPDWFYTRSRRDDIVTTPFLGTDFDHAAEKKANPAFGLPLMSNHEMEELRSRLMGFSDVSQWDTILSEISVKITPAGLHVRRNKLALVQILSVLEDIFVMQALIAPFRHPLISASPTLLNGITAKLNDAYRSVEEANRHSTANSPDSDLLSRLKFRLVACLSVLSKATRHWSAQSYLFRYLEHIVLEQYEAEDRLQEGQKQSGLDDLVLEKAALSLSFLMETHTSAMNPFSTSPQEFCAIVVGFLLCKPYSIQFALLRLCRSLIQPHSYWRQPFVNYRPSFILHNLSSLVQGGVMSNNFIIPVLWASVVFSVVSNKGVHISDVLENSLGNDAGMILGIFQSWKEGDWGEDHLTEQKREATEELTKIVDSLLRERSVSVVSSNAIQLMAVGIVNSLMIQSTTSVEEVLWHCSEFLPRFFNSLTKDFSANPKDVAVDDDDSDEERGDNSTYLSDDELTIPKLELAGSGVSEEEHAFVADPEYQSSLYAKHQVRMEYDKGIRLLTEVGFMEALYFHFSNQTSGKYKKMNSWARVVWSKLYL